MNRIGRLLSFGAAFALMSASLHAQNVSTNLLVETKFGPDSIPGWGYGYFYGNNGLGAQAYNRSLYAPEDTDMTNGFWQFTFDATDLLDAVNWGAGTGGPLVQVTPDPALFVSGDRADYIFTFDARVEGLSEGSATANGEMQVQFYYRNQDGVETKSLQVNIPFQPSSEWKTFSVSLADGSLGDNTADANFEAHAAETFDVRFNVNFHEPFRQFGYDADNALYLDNVKLEVIDRPDVTNPPPTFARTFLEWNMDDKGVWYEYHYDWSQNDIHATVSAGNNANNASPNTLGVDGSSAWFLNLDNTGFVDLPPQYAGGGSGGGGPADYTGFDTDDLSKYRVAFDARAIGLAEGRESSAAALQLFLDAPDDTVTPADEDTGLDRVVQLNFNITGLTSEFKSFSFPLDKGGVGSGSKALFSTLYNKISEARTQWQIENIASLADWGFDAENTLVIDNIRLERIYEGLGAIAFSVEGNELVLNWTAPTTGATTLQSATNVEGPYTPVTTTGSTHRVAISGPQQYFRLVWNP